MTRDCYRRCWRYAAALALLFALALLLVPQVQHGHASLLLAVLVPVLLLAGIVITLRQDASVDKQTYALHPLLLPFLSHLPPPGTLA